MARSPQRVPKNLTSLLLLFVLTGITASAQRSADGVWNSVEAESFEASQARGLTAWVRPDRFRAVELDPTALDVRLVAPPKEFTTAAMDVPTVVTLPRPDGTFERFAVADSPVMEPGLEQTMADEGFPMKTYSGTGLDNPNNTVRFDWGGPAGFHAMVLSPEGDYFIDPYWKGDTIQYVSYFRRDYSLDGAGKTFECEIDYPEERAAASEKTQRVDAGTVQAAVSTGGALRTYRTAVAATGEYTTFHGGTVAGAQAAIVTAINRINLIYEREISVRLVLIANNSNLIYTNAGTDPYTNSCNSATLSTNHNNINTVIGSANYDIGHVFGTGGGGIATLGVPCISFLKGRGCSGSGSPQGDPFYVDLVAHEFAHQFDADHSWSGSIGNCSASNFSAAAAYEPGSGSTIQSYSGICGADNLQIFSDDYFHRISLDQMGTYVNGAGSCFNSVNGVNPNEPTVNAGANHTIPISTPFELTASGSDADGDPITFNWEQFDLGVRAPLSTGDNGVQPIFRSWPATSSPTRVFPRAENLVAGTTPLGETLPVTNRTMNFRVTVRDNRLGGGREDDDAMQLTSTTTAGPFTVTSPNGGENITGGGTHLVTWNVANTAGGLVNTPNVDISLSSDGGFTFPTDLLSNTPNDGSELVTFPIGMSTASARVKVKGSGNVFFDISNSNFSLNDLSQCRQPGLALQDPGSVSDQMVIAGSSNLADLNLTLDISHTWVGDLSVTLEHVDTGTSVTVIDRPGFPASNDGCFRDNIQADLDDEAATPVEGQCSNPPPAITGTFSPNNPLSAFDGESVGGTWRLTVADAVGPDTGSLNMWCLGGAFQASSCPADLVLANQTITGVQSYSATNSITFGPSVTVNGTNVTANAPSVSFLPGTSISGTFSAGNSPVCP